MSGCNGAGEEEGGRHCKGAGNFLEMQMFFTVNGMMATGIYTCQESVTYKVQTRP